jgi:nucleosome assembly protein 1-like 1
LEAKYQKLYDPLYSKRFEIVNGITNVERKDEPKNNTTTDENKEEEKGVPEFWLTAMKTNEVLSVQITDRDEGALKYLKDIKWCRIDNPKDFKIDFYFDMNPFFKNFVLKKTYHDEEVHSPLCRKDRKYVSVSIPKENTGNGDEGTFSLCCLTSRSISIHGQVIECL